MNKFIDISEYNNVMNYGELSNAALRGVIIKASEGVTFTDSTFNMKYEELKNNNINIGFYHFLVITSEPEKQAEHFYSLIENKQMQIYPVLDVEQFELKDKAEEYSVRFINRFKELSGLNMIIYSGRCFIEEHFTCKFITNNKWWVADYSENKPIFATDIVAWQYTDCCNDYSSIVGGVDCSILYDEDSFYLKVRNDVQENTRVVVSEDVEVLQLELNTQGFTDKNGNKLDVDNKAGELTLSACPTICVGVRGNITKWLQQYFGINDDGIFGVITKSKVVAFQVANGLLADGIVGQKTWSKILGLEV